MRLYDTCKLFAAAMLLALLSFVAWAHEGHDHGVGPAAISVPAMPRAEAGSDTFELVAVASAGSIYEADDEAPAEAARIAVSFGIGGSSARLSLEGGELRANALVF